MALCFIFRIYSCKIIKKSIIISGIKYNFGNEEMFHDTSAIYKISNERIQDYVTTSDVENINNNISSLEEVMNKLVSLGLSLSDEEDQQ